MYTTEMSHDSVLGDRIVFIHGGNILSHVQLFGYKLLATSSSVA